MELLIRHISGSRAGEEQTFQNSSISIGRDPSSDVLFDAHRDLLVSGRHAEITRTGDHWTVRDLGSSNGTWISGEKVTSRELRSGTRIEFGRGGPSIDVLFDEARLPAGTSTSMAAAVPGTTVMNVQDMLSGRKAPGQAQFASAAPPLEGGTTVMGLDDIRSAAGPGKGTSRDAAKGTGPKRRSPLFIGLLAFLVTLIAGIVVVAIMTPAEAPPVAEATMVASADPAAIGSEQDDPPAPDGTTSDQQTPPSGNLSNEDLERQYRESQAVIDRLHQELAAKNAELATPKVVVKYVPRYITVPAGEGTRATTPPPSREPATPSEPASSLPYGRFRYEASVRATGSLAIAPVPQMVEQEDDPAPQPVTETRAASPPVRPLVTVREQPVQSAPPSRPLVTVTEQVPPQRVVPPAVTQQPAQRVTPAPRTPAQPSPAPSITPAPPAVNVAPPPPAAPRIAEIKRLKRRVNVTATESDFPPPSMPDSISSGLEEAVAAALSSTGTVLIDQEAPLSVQVSVTNYSVIEKKLGTGRVSDVARNIGSLAGFNAPGSSSSAARASWDVSLTASVSLVDAKGRTLETTKASAAVKESQSSVTLDSVGSFGESSDEDSPLHDAMRQLSATAAENVLRSLRGTAGGTWSGTVLEFEDGVATLDIGRTVGLAPDDVLEVIHSGTGIAQLQVDSVQESTSTATLVAGSSALTGKAVRYLGSPFKGTTAPSMREPFRTVRVARAAEARTGPGRTFQKAATVAPGLTFRQVLLIGGWVKVDRGQGQEFWLPSSSVSFE